MAAHAFPEMLKSSGWIAAASPTFAENAGRGASVYYSLENALHNSLAVAVFEAENFIRFRVYDPATSEGSWLQITIDADVDKIIAKIIAQQHTITEEETFRFYFGISGLGDVSVLAWEQYEDDYV